MVIWIWDWRWWYVVAIIEAWHRKVPNLKGHFPGTLSVVITGTDINAVCKDIRESWWLRVKMLAKSMPCYDVAPEGPVADILRDVEKMRVKK